MAVYSASKGGLIALGTAMAYDLLHPRQRAARFRGRQAAGRSRPDVSAGRERGLIILQPPTTMDFGRSFVALDPDGHRLRVFAPAQ